MANVTREVMRAEGATTDPIIEAIVNPQPGDAPVINAPQYPMAQPAQPLTEAQKIAEEYAQSVKSDTGFLDTFSFYALEPLLGIAQRLEDAGVGDISFDEEKAKFFKDRAQLATEDNPILGGVATLAGMAAPVFVGGPLNIAGRGAGALTRGVGAGKTAGTAVEFGTTGALYGQTLPELGEEVDRTQASITGGLLSAATGGLVRGVPAIAQRIRDVEITEMPTAPKTPVGRALQTTAEGLDYIGGALSTRIGNINQGLKKKVREFEFDAKTLTSDKYGEVEDFVTKMSRIGGEDKTTLTKALLNGNFDTAINVMKRVGGGLTKDFAKLRTTLKNVRQDLIKAGYKDIGDIQNYFPRLVKDYKGLLNALGAEESNAVTAALKEYAAKNKIQVKEMDPAVRSEIIGQVLRGFAPKVSTKGLKSAKKREINEVTDELLPYYATPEESIEYYLRSTSHNIAKAKFFGKYEGTDQDSIQSLLTRMEDSGEITSKDAADLVPLLQARFIQGEMAPSAFIKAVRDIGYATTIANPLSALVQLGDLAQSAVLNGLRNTIASMFGRKRITVDEIGLRDTIIQELNEGSKTLEKLFRLSGFKRIDRLGKETFINAAFKNQSRQVQSEAGAKAFRQKYKDFYGDEIDGLIEDLRAGNITENVKFHLFNELSGIQPLSLSEMPEPYLRSPNGRIFYALKSFTLKQLDVIRNNIVNEYKRGNRASAIKFATRYAIMFSLANASIQTIRDGLTGRITSGEEAIEEFPNQMMWQVLSLMGINEYVGKRYLQQGDILGAAASTLTPAAPAFAAITRELADIPDFEVEPVARTLPVVGPAIPMLGVWYNFMFGGLEDYAAEQAKK